MDKILNDFMLSDTEKLVLLISALAINDRRTVNIHINKGGNHG